MFASFALAAALLAPAAPMPSKVSFLEMEGHTVAVYLHGVGVAQVSPLMILEEVGPQVFETSWKDKEGRMQLVRTSCATYSALDSCAREHAKGVAALEAVFPQPQFREVERK